MRCRIEKSGGILKLVIVAANGHEHKMMDSVDEKEFIDVGIANVPAKK